MVPLLKDLLLRTIWHIKVKDAALQEDKKYIRSMQLYEQQSLNEYSDGDSSKQVLSKGYREGEVLSVQEQINHYNASQWNPYYNLFHWIKDQLYEIESMTRAVDYVAKSLNKLSKDEKKNTRRATELANAGAQKKTWKTLTAKSKDDFE
jgi:hypothetical protein